MHYIVFTPGRPDLQRAWPVRATSAEKAIARIHARGTGYRGRPLTRLRAVAYDTACTRLRALVRGRI